MGLEIKTKINVGQFGDPLNHFNQVADHYGRLSQKIVEANERALLASVGDIERDLVRRGRGGKYLSVEVKKSGPSGLSVRIYPRSSGGSSTHIARIFMNSEEGLTGRKAYVLRKKRGYVISHSSGIWSAGDFIAAPVRIPAIGAYAFSGKTGGSHIPIHKMAHDAISNNLNKQHKTLLKRVK